MTLLLLACDDHADGHTIKGEPIVIKEHQVIVVTYWAKWCYLCKGNIPSFNALQDDLQDKVMVLGIDFDQHEPEDQQKMAQALHMDYDLLQGELKGVHWTVPENIPITYVFSPKTHQLYSTLKGSLDLYTLKETVNNALDESD